VTPRSLVFDIYGDYVRYRGGEIALRDLTALLGAFHVTEETARVTLSRMKREGWLETRRVGRGSWYSLNERSWRLLDEGHPRIFQRRTRTWDGRWHMVIYSVPEAERPMRERLRKALAWLGFGPLAPSTWISPYDRIADLQALLDDDDVKVSVDTFTADTASPDRDRELAARCWDLDGIDATYRAFSRLTEQRLARLGPSAAEAFVNRVQLVYDYRRIPFADPDLPPELLPSGWSGQEAHALFLAAYDRLADGAFAHYDATAAPPPPRP